MVSPKTTRARATRGRETSEHRLRVGRFVRERRTALGLTQADVIQRLQYKSKNSVSNIERGKDGLPAHKAFAWAEVLELPEDAFFRFVTGDVHALDMLDEQELKLTETWRRLTPSEKRRVLAFAKRLADSRGA